MLSMISATLFLLGLFVSLWRTREPGYLLLNGYFWGGTLSVGIFAVPPSADSYRMLVAIVPAFVMASIGLEHLLEMIGVGWKNTRVAYLVSTGAVLISLLFFK